MSDHERRYFRVRGRVQDVGFRYFAQATASQLKLIGHVRNRPDGDVELEAEGPSNCLDRLEDAIRKGPPGARVDEVSSDPRPITVTPAEGFRITA